MSRNSHCSPDLGNLSLIRREEELVILTSCHVNVVDGSCLVSSGARSSPSLADAKKAVVAAAQITCFDSADQLDLPIRCPIRRSKGNVTTRLVPVFAGAAWASLMAPFSIELMRGSSW